MALLSDGHWAIIIGAAATAWVLLCVMGLGLLLLRRRARHLREKIDKLEQHISVLSSGAVGMGQKMLSLEARIKQMRDEQEEIKHSETAYTYSQAQKWIAEGIDNSAIAANSGLSTTEINLMRMLYGANAKSSVHEL